MKKLAVLSTLVWDALAGGINWDIYEHGVVDSFRWSRPFPEDGTDPGGFHVHCKAEGTFHAKMYKLSDLIEPVTEGGLQPWRFGIEEFLARRSYPGSWDGVDHKDQNREIVVMEYVDVPEPVRRWIEEQQHDVFEEVVEGGQKTMRKKKNDRRWLFAIFEKPKRENQQINDTVAPKPTDAAQSSEHAVKDEDKIVVFAAGAAYEILPLWVSKGSRCERALSNLTKYKHQAEEDAILAWVVDHTKPHRDLGKRDITFKIEAMEVTESDEGKRSRLMWEKLHRTLRRNERRIQKEERMKVRRELSEGRIKDEL